jgi:hypothetical protein
MSKTYVSVCKNTVLSNLKHGTNKPTIRVSKGKHGRPTHWHEFTFNGKGKIVYSPNKPMPWGARVWIELENK